MMKAMIFNWSGTLSDYGGRGRTTWYQEAGGKSATATQLAIHNRAEVLGVFDQKDWLAVAKSRKLNTIDMIEGSRMIGLSQPAWQNLSACQQSHMAQQVRQRFIQLGVDNTIDHAQALLQFLKAVKQLEVRA